MIKLKIETPEKYWDTITKTLKITVDDGLKDVARLASQRAASSTFPAGTSNKTKDILEKAIYKDINKAYLCVTGNVDNLESDGGEYLLSHRSSKGRIPSDITKKPISRSNYEKIKDKFVERAGMVKAGWLQAASKLKETVRTPVWLRKKQDLASVVIDKDSITITNNVKYASDLITDKQLKNLMENAFSGLLKRAEKMKLD